ncbi:hypothetical protein RR46_08465 [Papilio xuthus]|uniref:SUZ domain-containing protein n=1 Tax=Papilio xuthus TaxID=66420 RepID=A0A194PH52_PAPXU|nr:hypothetical protein RR46_08465 [Papilio xuthus]
MAKDSTSGPKYCKVLGNQLMLMYSLTKPIRTQKAINKRTWEALNDDKPAESESEPAKPIEVLKRPSHLARGQVVGGSHTIPLQGLELRRREYEQARQRIFGEARNPEDDDDDSD